MKGDRGMAEGGVVGGVVVGALLPEVEVVVGAMADEVLVDSMQRRHIAQSAADAVLVLMLIEATVKSTALAQHCIRYHTVSYTFAIC